MPSPGAKSEQLKQYRRVLYRFTARGRRQGRIHGDRCSFATRSTDVLEAYRSSANLQVLGKYLRQLLFPFVR